MANRLRVGMVVVLVAGLVGSASAEVASAVADRPAAKSGTLVKLRKTSHGKVLVGPNGKSLYDYTRDSKNTSRCNALCRSAWPPLMTKGKPRAGDGLNARKLGQTANHQVTYYGRPLYYYYADAKPGDTNGQGSNGAWYLINAKGKEVR